MLIAGTATLAFSPDLKWFKGSILGENRDTYIIRGWLNRVIKPDIEEGEELTSLFPELGSSAGSATSDGDQLRLEEKEELTYSVYITDFDTAITKTLQVHIGQNHDCRSVEATRLVITITQTLSFFELGGLPHVLPLDSILIPEFFGFGLGPIKNSENQRF